MREYAVGEQNFVYVIHVLTRSLNSCSTVGDIMMTQMMVTSRK